MRRDVPRLYAYTVRFDTGFAPHVDARGCFLTLATCKPGIRAAAGKRDWVLGVAGRTLKSATAGRVVFLAEITENPMSFDRYFRDPRFQGRWDNIYFTRRGKYRQVGGARFHASPEEM